MLATQHYFCKMIVPGDILPYLTEIMSQEEEQVIKCKENNEGAIRATRLLVGYLLRSTDPRWPETLMEALDNIDCKTLRLLLDDEFNNKSS